MPTPSPSSLHFSDWKLAASASINSELCGEHLSRPNFDDTSWLPVTVPGTIAGGQIEAGELPFPYEGITLPTLPGYKAGRESHMDAFRMPAGSPYLQSWWYRRCFTMDEAQSTLRHWLFIDGCNYAATLWINGRRVAAPDTLVGPYRRHRFDITRFLRFGEENAVAIEVQSQHPDDLGLTFIDWTPTPPDDMTGLWQPVRMESTGPLAIRDVNIIPEFNKTDFTSVDISATILLENPTAAVVSGILKFMFGDISVEKTVTVDRFDTAVIHLSGTDFSELRLVNPSLWWPYQIGTPHRYQVSSEIIVDGIVSDTKEFLYGLRKIESYFNEDHSRVFRINGHDLLLRGSAWAPDLLLRDDPARDEIDIQMLKECHFNTLRFEGFLGSDRIWDICDREGILVLAGWPCCNHFEKWDEWKEGDLAVACAMMRDQLIRLRNHSSLIGWFYGSDFAPPVPVERAYLEILKELAPWLPHMSSASHRPSDLTGDAGVKMTGPYSYEPPIHWYMEAARGRAHGFNTETGPDATIPRIESLVRFIPEDQRFVSSTAWMLHTGLGGFLGTAPIEKAVAQRFGAVADLEEFSRVCQVIAYEAWRAMYESHLRNWPKATGVIGWMHNSAWPSLIWQLYDWYLLPTGAFWGSRRACAPLHVFYAHDDLGIYLGNTSFTAYDGLQISIKRYAIDGLLLDEEQILSGSKNYGSTRIAGGSHPSSYSGLYFLQLTIEKDGCLLDRNVYWLSTGDEDELDFESQIWYHEQMKASVDFSPLKSLASTTVSCSVSSRAESGRTILSVSLVNTGTTPAFGIHVDAVDPHTKQILAPVYWEDNCIALMPGEHYSFTGRCAESILSTHPYLTIHGWNMNSQRIELPR